MKRILNYRGPIRGTVRVLLNRRRIEENFNDLLAQVNERVKYDNVSATQAIIETNEANRNDPFGMYVFAEETLGGRLSFGFRDCKMRDIGCYELVG